jgi:hypothetical protein
MKITAEIEIDWIHEDEGLDEKVERRLLDALVNKIEGDFLKEAGKSVAQAANRLITAKTELLINSVLEKPVTVSNGWNDKREYDSIYAMVEQRMTELYEGKLNVNGQCKKDPLLANIEGFVKSSTDKLLKDVERIVEKHAKEAAAKEVKEHELFKTLEKVVSIKTA